MDILYRRGKSSATKVREAMPNAPSYSAVRAMLRVLEDKVYVRHQAEGLKYVRFAILLVGSSLFAQPDTSLLSRADFIQNWKTSKEFTIAVAETMPEELYRYKANPGEMNFAGLMVHVAGANRFRFAQISEDKAPAPATPKQWSKATIIDYLRESFDYCIGKLGTITEEQLKKQFQVDWYERPKASGAQILLGMYAHTAHHRAQAEVYMRANNIKPPDYRP